jgi:hypothetical protein
LILLSLVAYNEMLILETTKVSKIEIKFYLKDSQPYVSQ